MKKRKLGFYSLGNGITVADSLHEKNGDYEFVAHIEANRSVKYKVELSTEDKKNIEDFARRSDPSVSTSQPERKVFTNRPNI